MILERGEGGGIGPEAGWKVGTRKALEEVAAEAQRRRCHLSAH